MQAADINIPARSLSPRSVVKSDQVAWTAITKVTLCRLPSLLDEIGMVLETADTTLYVRETQQGYTDLFNAFQLDSKLPIDWYPQVEAGQRFSVSLSS